ncbi:hypothetical protein [Sphingomonas sp. BK036]|jgi:hypothetical protein|uniref:hypothetical protein n=1 Tax=Sphingomonas sp. BK036 TaxID=2512122 RepID=UPI0013EE5633|nr:hypothetical protein [Sphingomonas sp. BK036]
MKTRGHNGDQRGGGGRTKMSAAEGTTGSGRDGMPRHPVRNIAKVAAATTSAIANPAA